MELLMSSPQPDLQPLNSQACKPHPMIGLRGQDIFNSSRTVLAQTIRQPLHSVRHIARFSVELKNVLLGQSTLRPATDDRRFTDPAWALNPLYRRYQQIYLAWRNELHDWHESRALPEHDIRRRHFIISLLTEAMSPTNSLANPAALKRFFETGGKSLVDGMAHLTHDALNNGGMPSQVNKEAF